MVAKKRVAVIGGGVSGLAAVKAFGERGHAVSAFEQSADLGGVWEPSRSYPGVQTQSPKDLYCYTGHAMPADYPEWPKGPQVHAYLKSYADKHGLLDAYAFNTRVTGMDRRKDGRPGWTLNLEKAGKQRSEDYDFVAVCTGQFSEKNIISHPGQKAFEAGGGTVMHSSEYTDPAMIKGKNVVVLGGSKSATDIAVNAAAGQAASVTMVYRENVWRVPYHVGGINFKHLVFMRAQEIQFNRWGRGPLARAAAALFKPMVWANFRGLEALLKLQLGLKKHDMVPDQPIEHAISCALPVVTPGFFEALNDGSITAYKGTIERYEDGRAVLSGGQKLDADVVVLAIGWKLGVPFLAQNYQDRLIEADGQYRLYRLAVNPDLPCMGFVGFNSSFCTVLSAEMIANWLVRYCDGQLARQPSRGQMNENMDMMLNWRRRERPAAQVYGGLCSAPFHFAHFDELLEDMGATKRKRTNVLAEQFSYPRHDIFGKFLASTPQYTAQ